MSNLGGYAWITGFIKSVGGPEKALKYTIAAAGGIFVAGGAAFAGAQKGVRLLKEKLEKRASPCPTRGETFKIHTDGEDATGVSLRAGGEFTVLECDGPAILIQILGDADNPYFVSSEFLSMISNFPTVISAEDE